MNLSASISGSTRLMCVIGHPVAHSLSPKLHTALAEATGVDAVYLAFDVTPDTLDAFVAFARTQLLGFNVTMPLKERIIPFLDELDPLATRCKAVNTVVVRSGKLVGYNTDSEGFVPSLGANVPKNAMILGKGGASKAVAAALDAANIPNIQISVRDDRERLPELAAKYELIVNATPLGMAGHEQFRSFEWLDRSTALIYDLVYNPLETKLLQEAAARGLRTLGGVELLKWQGILAFEKFTGKRPETR